MKKGFTLIEVVIAILVLSVSTLVIIAMQTSTLRGYRSIRDNDDGVMIAHRVADLLQINATTWRDGAGNWGFENKNPFSTGDNAPFDQSNPLKEIKAANWGWVSLFKYPVDARMAYQSSGSGSFGGRHCVFVRGAPFEGSLTSEVDAATGAITASPAMTVHIVVVSSGVKNRMTDCDDPSKNTPPFSFSQLDDYSGGDPIPLGWNLESQGYRPVYHSTMVYRRNY